ncbi:MAG: hypothetical protein K9J30_02450 [Bacteroidales bacterium]|nr:hypothetical protein [Bacteroidales bacterium]
MISKRTCILFVCTGISLLPLKSQSFVSINGYINDMQSVYHVDQIGWLWENQVHNRLNINVYPALWLNLSFQGRTRFQQNNLYGQFPGYTNNLGLDPGWFDLTWSFDDAYNNNAGYIFTTSLDRAYAEFSFGDFVGTVGRQRINWGQTFVWNPNDIFNSYSYFDVDYPERPGSDAIRLQYYTGMASNIELAVKLDSSGSLTTAGYFRFNTRGYDFQFIGGVLSAEDLVLGAGWSGNIQNVSFRGETTYFRDLENFADTAGNFMVSVGLDYTFSNSLWLRGELLYSGFADKFDIYSLTHILAADMNVKNLGFTEWSLFSSISYPVNPLFNISVAGIYYPEWKGFYLGPSFDYSLANNLSASLIFQGFSAKLEDPLGNTARENTFIGYARIKWSF